MGKLSYPQCDFDLKEISNDNSGSKLYFIGYLQNIPPGFFFLFALFTFVLTFMKLSSKSLDGFSGGLNDL